MKQIHQMPENEVTEKNWLLRQVGGRRPIVSCSIVIFIALLLLLSCSLEDQQSRPERSSAVSKPPLALGISYDISGSVRNWPEPDSIFLDQIARIVGARGGVIALGHISESSFQTLLRYRLRLDTTIVSGKLSQRAARRQRNVAGRARFDWEVRDFVRQALDRFVVTRDRPLTDIDGSLARFGLLFDEPIYDDYDKVLIVLSDGRHNSSEQITHIPNANIFTVGWPPEDARKVFGPHAKIFESLDGAIVYLSTTNDGD